MSQLIATLPDEVPLHEGDQLDLRVILGRGTMRVTKVLRREPAPQDSPRPKLGDWGRKWAGTLKLQEGQTRDDLRMQFYREKYGL
jgi:hypothetical protein